MSAPASPAARIGAQARFDTLTLLRNGEQLMVSLLIPAMALVGLVKVSYPDLSPDRRVDALTPGILALAIISTAFTGQAIATGFDRRYGVLRLLGASPLGRGGLLAGRILAVLVIEALQMVVLGAIGLALGWHPAAVGILPVLVFWLLGTVCFVAFAFTFAGTLRAEATLALANIVFVLIMAAGGVILPGAHLGAPWGDIVSWLPSAALGDGLRAAFEHGRLAWRPLLVLAAWAAGFSALAARFFRWSD